MNISFEGKTVIVTGAGHGIPIAPIAQEASTETASAMIAAMKTLPNWLAVHPR